MSCDDLVEVVCKDVCVDGIGRYHVKGGEKDKVIGEDTERDRVTRTSENILQTYIIIIITV